MKVRWKTVGLSAFAVAVIGGVTVLSQTGPIFPTSEVEAPASTVIVDESPEPTFTPTPTVTPTPTPTQEPVVEAPAPPPPAPVKCPAGTEATRVDDAGNESGCIPKNNQGETCQAFNDAGECTAWASGTRRLEPVL